MATSFSNLPELQELSSPGSLLRLPDQLDVPLTPRIKKVIDCREFRRLQKVSQLGLVALVYPGATHTRFEHSLGVYRNALLFLKRLSTLDRFCEHVSQQQATVFLLAALLHDLGHFPFCHPIEDLNVESFHPHEHLARNYLLDSGSEIAAVVKKEFDVQPEAIVEMIEGKSTEDEDSGQKILKSVLSGPIDVDKLDYLYRDSLHSGVPYGRNFDAPRLISSLCLNENNDRLAITSKGRTAAELLVFARYVMFSEVYWHHAVRSATAMLQRAVYEMFVNHPHPPNIEQLYQFDDRQFGSWLLQHADTQSPHCKPLLDGLFGPSRGLYKRLGKYSCLENESLYRKIARKPYGWLVDCAARLARELETQLEIPLAATDVLIDAPPMKLEVQFDVDVFYSAEKIYRPLGDVSPVVHTLAKQQFDDLVKQVHIFACPRVCEAAKKCTLHLDKILQRLVEHE